MEYIGQGQIKKTLKCWVSQGQIKDNLSCGVGRSRSNKGQLNMSFV